MCLEQIIQNLFKDIMGLICFSGIIFFAVEQPNQTFLGFIAGCQAKFTFSCQ